MSITGAMLASIASRSGWAEAWSTWMRRAACLNHDPDEFDVEWAVDADHKAINWLGDENRPVRAAKRICYGCPVREECLGFALGHETGEFRDMVYGGLTGKERAKIRTVEEGSALLERHGKLYWLKPIEEVVKR
jgi:WhiB family redox-sensing transcriptional regulator